MLAAPPCSPAGATSLIPWGQAGSDTEGGLAFRTDQGQVVLLRTRLRAPNLVSADLAVTGTISPNPARVGDPVLSAAGAEAAPADISYAVTRWFVVMARTYRITESTRVFRVPAASSRT